MQNISISDEFTKSVSKEDFVQHFKDNGYDWSDTDIIGFWTMKNPTPPPVAAEKPAKPEKPVK